MGADSTSTERTVLSVATPEDEPITIAHLALSTQEEDFLGYAVTRIHVRRRFCESSCSIQSLNAVLNSLWTNAYWYKVQRSNVRAQAQALGLESAYWRRGPSHLL